MFEVGKIQRIRLGHVVENGVTDIQFDMTPWLDKMSNPVVSIWATRHDEEYDPYPVLTELDGNILTWRVTRYDTAKEGTGICKIVIFDAEKRRRFSCDIETIVDATAVGITGEEPEGYAPWIEQVISLKPLADEAIEWSKRAVAIFDAGMTEIAEMNAMEVDAATIGLEGDD